MKKHLALGLGILLTLGLFTACNVSSNSNKTTSSASSTVETKEKKFIIHHEFDANSLKETVQEETSKGNIYVYLPPDYYTSTKKYPVVYYLHGFGDSPQSLLQKSIFDNAMLDTQNHKMIIVAIDGTSIYGGSFYYNSIITGKWEDYVYKDTVQFVDAHYRTIASSDSRGLFGFSMGGFGVISVGMRHSDVFSSVYALAPGLFDKQGLKKAMKDWEGDQIFLSSYGSTFAPSWKDGVASYQIPKFDGSTQDNEIINAWENGFGNLPTKINEYVNQPTHLKNFTIDYGTSDEYAWIPEGCRYFSQLLTNAKIPHTLLHHEGGHGIPPSFIEDNLVPYFSKTLNNTY